MDLTSKKCTACEGGVEPFDDATAHVYAREVPKWSVAEDYKSISREFIFKDFVTAIDFVRDVADIAEGEGHHPDIHIFYNRVRLDLSTHSIKGLSENDFILAAKIDALPVKA